MRKIVTLTVLLVGATAVVHADEAGPAAAPSVDVKELYKRATAHFNLGRFKEAAEEYEQVFEAHPDPVLLYNIAQAYRGGGMDEKALFFYRSYLQRAPKAANRAEVADRITALEKSLREQAMNRERPPNGPAPLTEEPKGMEKKAAAAVSPAEEPRSADRQPVYKKWWLWTIVGVAAVGIGLGVGLGVGLSSTSHFSPNLPEGGPAAATLKFP